ncbi:MAG: hypothetical protein RIA69_05655 [Cyclobacteriaceae bacterium]
MQNIFSPMLLLLLSFIILHPFHVSVTEVTYLQNAKALQVTQRIFYDDLEKGIQEANKNDDYRLTIPLDPLAKEYLINETSISAGGNKAVLLGAEEDKDLVWVYFEIESLAPNSKITFQSTLLTRTFDDQENLLHFKLPSGKETYRLNANKEKVSIEIK